MSLFETTSVGRIINPFSSDVNELDEGLLTAIIDLIETTVRLGVSLAAVIVGAPTVVGVMIPQLFLYYYYQTCYQGASGEIKRLLIVSRSPISFTSKRT
jgi:ATP-binding cassette subfamily C (CFTR/MRP) protein 1